MDAPFEIIVPYLGQERHFDVELLIFGYSYKFKTEVNGITVYFEPDEERNYRAILEYGKMIEPRIIDKNLLEAISETISSLVR